MTNRPGVREAAVALIVFVAQAAIVGPLFAGPLTRWRGSIEAAFITDARFIADHFPNLSWNPLWYMGFPFELFYTPLLQVVTALAASPLGGAAPAYRVVAAIGYALGPAALYLLARRLALPAAAAVLAAAVFALGPSLALALPGLYPDASAFAGSAVPAPWRLVALVEYGEGPHVLGLSLLLFASAALHGYLAGGRRAAYWLAVGLFVAVALTNLIALLGGAIFAAGVTFAVPGKRERLERALRVGAMAGLLSLAWYSPGFIRAVVGFSTPGGEGGGSGYLALPVIAAAIAFALRRARMSPAVAVGAFVSLVCVAILFGWYVLHVPLAPQPIRYALELDAAFALLAASGAWALARRALAAARSQTAALAVASALVLLLSAPGWVAARESVGPDPDSTSWSEREVALWLAQNLAPGERAYLSGSHAFWVDVFADVPQIRGGVDFAGTDPWWAHATYQINTGSDVNASVLWLRALGVRYTVVTGAGSKDVYRDFAKPDMFDGRLALAATVQGTRIYRVDDPHAGAALATLEGMPAAPRDALDRVALDAYLRWLTQAPSGGTARVVARSAARWDVEVRSPTDPAELALPFAYDEGWRAYLEDLDNPHYAPLPLRPHADPVGLLAVTVPTGHYDVRLEHGLHRDHLLSLAVVFGGLGGLGLWWSSRRAPVLAVAAPAAIAAATIAYAVALGVVGGFPKGTDALMHLTRLKFVADWFPDHNWLYAWSAGMPTFTTYPALPYLVAVPFVRLFGAVPTLDALALLGEVLLGLGIYGHLRARGRPMVTAFLAALMAMTSLAIWEWIVEAGVYARIISLGIGAMSWWTHARAVRGGGPRWWVATIVLVAAAVASHVVMGALSSLYLAASHLAARRAAGLPRLALLAGLAFLLAAPAMIPTIADGMGRRFVGFARADLSAMNSSRLVNADWVGFAAFLVPAGIVLVELLRFKPKALLPAALLGAPVLYGIAPALGIPSSLYYFRGIDPSSVSFLVALAGALTYGAVAPDLAGRAGRAVAIAAAALIGVNAIAGVPRFVSPPDYPTVVDTASRYAPEELARASLSVNGADRAHRLMPFTATESVGFSYWYGKPMLRDYYDQGQVHPDWIAWAFNAVYAPPVAASAVHAVAEWFALDTITVPAGERNDALAAVPGLRPVVLLPASPYRQYAVADPTTIAATTTAPLNVVVADAAGYDRALRLLMAGGATPRTRLPVWWSGAVADLPADLADAARAVLVVGERVGDPALARAKLDALGSRAVSVVWDIGDVATGDLAEPWPNLKLATQDITAWDIRDRSNRIGAADFSPARYGDGPWRATVPQGLRDGGVDELSLAGSPLIASRGLGRATLTVVGGNLFYHALINGNANEIAYLMSYLGPAATGAEREPSWSFVNPDLRLVATDGAPIVLREAYHPNWHAVFVASDGTTRDVAIHETGPGLMAVIPPGAGEVRFEFRASLAETFAWLLFLGGVGAIVVLLRRRAL